MKHVRLILRTLEALALALALLDVGACGSDGSTGNQLTSAQVAGDWTLMSFQIVPQPALTPPNATGTLHLTDSRYRIILIRNAGDAADTVLADSGTYTVSGSSWTQTSDDPATPSATGSVLLTNNAGNETLQVNATAGGVATHSFWSRAP